MTWLLVGGTGCAIFVVLAGLWVGRTMRDLDRLTESLVTAPARSTVRPPAVPGPRRPEPDRCECGAEDCPVRPAHAQAARQTTGNDLA